MWTYEGLEIVAESYGQHSVLTLLHSTRHGFLIYRTIPGGDVNQIYEGGHDALAALTAWLEFRSKQAG